MKCTKTFVRVQWGGSGAFDAKNSDATSWHKLLHQFGLFCTEFCKSAKWSKMYQNMSLGSNGVERVRSLRKIPMPLRGTNFCTSSARFAPSFVTQPNGPQCTKIVRNAPEHEFRVQWDGSGEFVSKNFDATSYHELLYQFGPFCTEFRKSTKRSQMHQNSTKCTKTLV